MAWTLDARLPLVIVGDAAGLAAALSHGPKAAVLAEAPPPPLPDGAAALASFDLSGPSHAGGCACCGGRPPPAAALDRLFQARVRGACPWFERVVALAETPAARDAIAAALTGDAVTAARFRDAPPA
jgi:hypothetical protein